MRIFSVITAIIVAVTLYLVVIERDWLFNFAGRGDAPVEQTEGAAEDVAVVAEADDKAPVVPVFVVESQAQAVGDQVLLRGQTEAARQVDVRAETAGRVVSEPLRKGTFVQTGDVICEIDPGTRLANLAQADARLAEARARLPEAEARVKEAQAFLAEARINDRAAVKLKEGGFASETRAASTAAGVSSAEAAVAATTSGLDSASAGILAAEANVAAAQTEIDRLTMEAPFPGTLESDSAELGAFLQPGALCATVTQLDPIKLVGFVPETEINKVALGALAGARLSNGQEVGGTVSFLGRSADPQTRTFRIEVEIPNADLAIRNGQTVEMVVSSGTRKAHLLPQSTLTLNDDGTLGVRVVDAENFAQFVAVEVLRDTVEGIWLGGLPDEATVITIGQEYVTDGVKVAATPLEVTQ